MQNSPPVAQLAAEKEFFSRLNRPPGKHKVNTRDPILQKDVQQTPYKPQKVLVKNYLNESKRLQDRPRGIAKGEFSSLLQGSLNVNRDTPVEYRPSKKVFEPTPAPPSPERFSKRVRPQTPTRNPILQTEESFEVPNHYSKRVGYKQQQARQATCRNYITSSPQPTLNRQRN